MDIVVSRRSIAAEMTEGNLTARGLSEIRSERRLWIEWLSRVFLSGVERERSLCLVTLTFAANSWELSLGIQPSLSRVLSAGRNFEKCLTRYLERPSWFGVMEKGLLKSRAHLHFLVSARDIREDRIRLMWREGFINVRAGVSSPRAIAYVCKYLMKGEQRDVTFFAGGPLYALARTHNEGTGGAAP